MPQFTLTRLQSLEADYFDVRAFGGLPDGVTDSTAAVKAAQTAAAAEGGGTVYLAPGVWVFGDIPYLAGVHVRGAGIGATFIRPNAANVPVFAPSGSGASDGVTYTGFTVKAHAAGSTGPAIIVGSQTWSNRRCVFDSISYQSNGAADFAQFFELTGRCYYNHLDRILVDTQGGPATVLLCSNGGAGSGFNPNANFLRGWLVYANTAISTIIDAGDSTLLTIEDCGFEANGSGCVAVIPGESTIWQGGWVEANATAVCTPLTSRSVTPNDCTIKGVQFNGATLTIPAGVSRWDISACPGLTVTDTGGSSVVRTGSTANLPATRGLFGIKNGAAGGGSWAWKVDATGGDFPGAVVLEETSSGHVPLLVRGSPPNYGVIIATNGTVVASPIRTVTASTTLLSINTSVTPDEHVLVNASAAVTITLPTSPNPGQLFTIKDISGAAGTNHITVAASSGNIDGAASQVISTNYGCLQVVWDSTSTNWHILASR